MRRRRRNVTGIFLLGALVVATVVFSSFEFLPFLMRPTPPAAPVPTATPSPEPETQVELTPEPAPTETPTPSAPTPTPGPAVINYIVLAGDTLLDLADRYDTTVEKLREYNDGLDPKRLISGEMIKVPDLAALRGEKRPRFDWPIFGPITTAFGERGSLWIGGVHPGLDVGGYMGDTIRTAGEGVIVQAGSDGMGRGYGTYVLIYHGDGWFTLYAHLSKIYREVGSAVSRSAFIGEVGMTGFADGPHLHFEVWHYDEKLDPLQFLP